MILVIAMSFSSLSGNLGLCGGVVEVILLISFSDMILVGFGFADERMKDLYLCRATVP